MGYKILVADDENFNREIVKDALIDEEHDYEILEAGDGLAVINMLEELNPDLLLLDIGMPKMSGLDVLENIRKKEIYESLPVIVITAYPEEKYHALELGANDFIAKPIEVADLKLRVKNSLKLKKYSNMLEDFNKQLEEKVRERTQELKQALDKSRAAELEVIIKLGKAAEFRDLETGLHIYKMRSYSKLLAEKLGMGEDDVNLIYNASPLHDVGKVGIPDRILLKPARLTDKEFEIIKNHVEIGMEILSGHESFPLLNAAYYIIRDHHESWNGSGYPNGRKGSDIHIYGRICKVADVFDALTTKRVYKEAYSVEKAVSIMKDEMRGAFDPDILNTFVENIEDFAAIKEESESMEEDIPPILKIMSEIER